MLSFLVTLLVIAVVCGVLWWLIGQIPMGAQFAKIARVIVVLIALVWFLQVVGLFGGGAWRAHIGGM